MAKTGSDVTPPKWSGINTMGILRGASQSAKPPTMKGKSGGVPHNKRGK